MNRVPKMISALLITTVLIASGCSFGDTALPVSDLTVTKVVVKSNTTDVSAPPLTYDVTVSWNIADILANEKAAAALSGLHVYMQTGTEAESSKIISADATTYTFVDLQPCEYRSLKVEAVYVDGSFPDADITEYTASLDFSGGPWYDGTNFKAPKTDGGFGVGSFNNMDSLPASYFDASDVYYFNSYNTDYQFKAVGEIIWLIVAVDEVSSTNDTLTQRDNVQWLNKNFQLLDINSGLTNNDDIASVDAWIYDIYGEQLLGITGSATEGIMSSTAFSALLDSVDTGYYADKTGYYFIKAECKSMPASYSDSNKDDKYGLWGFANNGARR